MNSSVAGEVLGDEDDGSLVGDRGAIGVLVRPCRGGQLHGRPAGRGGPVGGGAYRSGPLVSSAAAQFTLGPFVRAVSSRERFQNKSPLKTPSKWCGSVWNHVELRGVMWDWRSDVSHWQV